MPALREALNSADYTYAAVAELLGETAHSALSRNETVPGLRRTRGGSPLETLTRLFLLQTPVSVAEADQALPGLVDRLCNEGLLEQSIGEVAARMDIRPYATDDEDLWVISDLTPGLDGTPNRVGTDHVLGISSAATSLAQLTLRDPVTRALDLGTGCGVQALHLAQHSTQVVATDINRRALWMTELNARLNGVRPGHIDVREGSFFEPVRGETFDLIATNPPFVISPATDERLVYRDSGLPGDRVVEDIVRAAPRLLTEGGWCQILANWVIPAGGDWAARLGEWITDCDAWVVQREVIDPAGYVELWLKDAGLQGTPDYVRRYDTWLEWFERQGIDGVGFGWINLRRTDAAPTLLLEEWPYDVEQPIAPAIGAWGDAVDVRRDLSDADLLAERPVLRSDVQQETFGAPGAEDPATIVLRQQRGMRRAKDLDTAMAAFAGACDGDLSVQQTLTAIASLLEVDAAELIAEKLPQISQLIAEGFLELG